MLGLWKLLLHLKPDRRDCIVERDDGVSLDDWLLGQIDLWYAHLLATAPVEWLPVEDVASALSPSADAQGVVTVAVPERCVRPVEWLLAGWQAPVSAFIQPGTAAEQAEQNVWTRSGKCRPAAVDYGDRLVLYSLDAGDAPVVTRARCVVRPADGTYVFHREALATVEDLEIPFRRVQ